jgi:hypothetical protein
MYDRPGAEKRHGFSLSFIQTMKSRPAGHRREDFRRIPRFGVPWDVASSFREIEKGRRVMKKPVYVLSTLVFLLWVRNALAQNPVTCGDRLPRVAALSLAELREATIDFAGDNLDPHLIPPGSFDPVPLLSMNVRTVAKCLVAHLSTFPFPADNHIVFQVRVDGTPMEGHHPDLFGFGVPAVSDPNRTDAFVDVPRMASYTFFKPVNPGVHKVEVLFAGCCSGTTGLSNGSVVTGATLTLQYR